MALGKNHEGKAKKKGGVGGLTVYPILGYVFYPVNCVIPGKVSGMFLFLFFLSFWGVAVRQAMFSATTNTEARTHIVGANQNRLNWGAF